MKKRSVTPIFILDHLYKDDITRIKEEQRFFMYNYYYNKNKKNITTS